MMLAIQLPAWLVDIWAVNKDVIVPALVMVLVALLTWVAIKIKADAKYQQAKSELQIQELKKLNEREDTRPELQKVKDELNGVKQANTYLAEMFDLVFQNSTLDENTKNSLTILKNKILFGVEEDIVSTLTAELNAYKEKCEGYEQLIKEASTVVTSDTSTIRTRR